MDDGIKYQTQDWNLEKPNTFEGKSYLYFKVSNKGTCTPIYFWVKIHPVCPYLILYVY